MLQNIILCGFLFATVLASSETKPNTASLLIVPNYDFGLTNKEFRVHYTGVTGFEDETISIKIFEEENEIQSFNVPANAKLTKKAYHFTSKDETAFETNKEFAVKVCAGAICSEKSFALSIEQSQENAKVTCTADGSESVSIDLLRPELTDLLNDDKINKVEEYMKGKTGKAYETEYSTHKLKGKPIPFYDSTTRLFYTGFSYNIKHYIQLFELGKTNSYCKRKYLLSAHAHIYNEQTNEIIQRLKKTLHLSDKGEEMFIFTESAPNLHIELTHKDVELPTGIYKVKLSLCATEKDVNESTFCTEPLTLENSLTVD